MAGLSEETLKRLYAPHTARENTREKREVRGYAWVRNSEGKLDYALISRMGDVDLGEFHGKVGSTHRSSKGRTVRHANGSRRYAHPSILSFGPVEVVAYKLNPPS